MGTKGERQKSSFLLTKNLKEISLTIWFKTPSNTHHLYLAVYPLNFIHICTSAPPPSLSPVFNDCPIMIVFCLDKATGDGWDLLLGTGNSEFSGFSYVPYRLGDFKLAVLLLWAFVPRNMDRNP